MSPLIILLGAYLAGSLPFGLIVARVAKGIDIREHGSKNIGATNVACVLGARWGTLCFLLDVLKGALPIGLLPMWLLPGGDTDFRHWQVAAGLMAILGHMFPVWLRFHGGKGVATALGVVLMLSKPYSTPLALAMFALMFSATRIVSLSSIAAAVTFLVAQMIFLSPQPFRAETWSQAAFSVAVPILIIVKHHSNIARLLRGEEKRFEFGKRKPSSDQPPSNDPPPTS